MTLTLPELVVYIRQTVPQSKAIVHLEIKEAMEAVTFDWQGRQFLVKPSLQVLETKNSKLYITGASILVDGGELVKHL